MIEVRWLIEAAIYVAAGAIVTAVICWWLDQFNNK